MLDLSILPEAQLRLWPKLEQVPQTFVLYGGTAIALRLAHRESVDFDFFTSDDFTSDDIVREMPFLSSARRLQESRNTLTLSCETSGSESPVKLSFFGGLQLGQINLPEKTDNGISIASLLDLLGMKCATINQRVEAKDYIDIHSIINHNDFSLELGLGAARAIYGKQYNAALTLKSLSYFEGGNLYAVPETIKHDLIKAVKACDYSAIPEISTKVVIGEIIE